MFESVEALTAKLASTGYFIDPVMTQVVYLAAKLKKPLLLEGPAGSGKSLIARTLAETLSCNFQSLSLADIKQEHLGASGKRVREIWDHARAHRPSIIFIDECDGVFGRRGAAETDVIAADVVGAFLPEWDGIEQTSGIMVIGATNKRSMLDDAILSRFGWEVEVPLPAAPERRHILEQELKANRIEMELPDDTGPLTQGMSGPGHPESGGGFQVTRPPEPTDSRASV
jgi:SpoVK/Ycf46/Vps4 family AAA+-type ATPase